MAGRVLAVLFVAIGLSGCAVPPMVIMASYVGDGVLFVSTGKVSSDVGASLATGKDCATWHLVKDEKFCQDSAHDEPEPLPPQIAEDEARAERQITQAPTEDGAGAGVTARILTAALQPVATAEPRQPVAAHVAKPVVTAAVGVPSGHKKIAAASRARHRVAMAKHRLRLLAAAKGHRHRVAAMKRRPILVAAHHRAKARPAVKATAAKAPSQASPVLVGFASGDVVVPPPVVRDRSLPRLTAAWSALLAAFTSR